MGRKGKYEEWLTPDGLLLLEGWARDGLTDVQIAKNIGINERTLYEWMNKYPQIAQAIKMGKGPVDILVENALFKRACGYQYTEIIEEYTSKDAAQIGLVKPKSVRRVTKEMPPDVGAAIFWLKNRRRDKWRDRPDLIQDADQGSAILDSINDVLTRRRGEHD